MPIRLKKFQCTIPKRGNKSEEIEDYCANNLKRTVTLLETSALFAISDGATETSFSNIWARSLVNAFITSHISIMGWHSDILNELSREWDREVRLGFDGKTLPWYVEEKLSVGTYATLLGLEINTDLTWRSICFGDSCLFQVSKEKLIRSLPYTEPIQFRSRPKLLATYHEANRLLQPTIEIGSYSNDDCFFLMTDALAEATMKHPDDMMKFLLHVKYKPQFKRKLEQLRDDGRCRNDDVAFMRIHIFSDGVELA